MQYSQEAIRNFCIIAHIDHGKSTLADRLLELTHTVSHREMKAQLLDSMDLERERGITIKLQPVRMAWKNHQLNLIDTPGHVDFSYEVSRSLAACEGAVLVVDAAQGIQAQTLANVYLAIEAGLEIIPVINKIDLPAAEPERVTQDLVNLLGCKPEDVIPISAKTGQGVDAILSRIINDIPPPRGVEGEKLRALVFDSIYDEYRGVILYVRIVDGSLNTASEVTMMGSSAKGEAIEVGTFQPAQVAKDTLFTGEIGYVVSSFKSVTEARVGDTLTTKGDMAAKALPGYDTIHPFVYAGFFPSSGEQHQQLKEAIEKLKLNDASLQYSPESSSVLGFGFRIGFLGLLHLDIVKERLEREFGLDLIVTNPSTDYQIIITSGEEIEVKAGSELPEASKIADIKEPWIKGEIIVPKQFSGNCLNLINDARGYQKDLSYLDENTAHIKFEAPLANILTDFYDSLKSTTSGYGSFSYELSDYRSGDLVKLDILVGGEAVDSLSQIIHRSEADKRGRGVLAKLKDVIPRQLYEVSLQAAIGGKIIAREDIRALGKNVTAKLYGGDVSRKNKLLDKQKKGKKRLKKIGKVEIPPDAFMVLLKKD